MNFASAMYLGKSMSGGVREPTRRTLECLFKLGDELGSRFEYVFVLTRVKKGLRHEKIQRKKSLLSVLEGIDHYFMKKQRSGKKSLLDELGQL